MTKFLKTCLLFKKKHFCIRRWMKTFWFQICRHIFVRMCVRKLPVTNSDCSIYTRDKGVILHHHVVYTRFMEQWVSERVSESIWNFFTSWACVQLMAWTMLPPLVWWDKLWCDALSGADAFKQLIAASLPCWHHTSTQQWLRFALLLHQLLWFRIRNAP